MLKSKRFNTAATIILTVLVIITLLPLALIVISSFTKESALIRNRLDPNIIHLYFDDGNSGGSVWMHLICGECGALLLDTGYGIGNLKSVIEQLTDKPVSVFNTHWHGDHTGGNSQFENVYMHEFDIPYWKESLSCEAGRMLPVTLAFSQDAVIPLSDKFIRAVHDGMTFHLGGRIETIVH